VTLKDSASTPKGKIYRQRKDEHPEAMDDGIEFSGPFPANASLSLSLPKQFSDDKGRDLVNAARFPLQFKTGDLPPMIKFAGNFGIIERVAGGLLPITLRNLEPDMGTGTAAKVRWIRLSDDAEILHWQKQLHQFDNPPYVPNVAQQPDPRRSRLLPEKSPRLVERTLPKPNGAQAFEVIGLPLERPGFYVVEAESQRLGKALLDDNRPMYVRSSALVQSRSAFQMGAGLIAGLGDSTRSRHAGRRRPHRSARLPRPPVCRIEHRHTGHGLVAEKPAGPKRQRIRLPAVCQRAQG